MGPDLISVSFDSSPVISIHGSRVGPDGLAALRDFCLDISIHGSRVGPDARPGMLVYKSTSISIHGSRVGPDDIYTCDKYGRRTFQSTGPVWDPTLKIF